MNRIEKSRFRNGEYVGYLDGALRIKRGGKGWQTVSLVSQAGSFVYVTARTLKELNSRLVTLAAVLK